MTVKKILTAILSAVFLSGCMYQADRRPTLSNDEVWICEEPYAEFYWEKGTDVLTGKIIVNNKEYNMFHRENSGPYLWVYSMEGKEEAYDVSNAKEYLLFRSRANYNYDTFTLQVEEDRANMFDGELPLLKFKCYKKSEYFKDKQGDK